MPTADNHCYEVNIADEETDGCKGSLFAKPAGHTSVKAANSIPKNLNHT